MHNKDAVTFAGLWHQDAHKFRRIWAPSVSAEWRQEVACISHNRFVLYFIVLLAQFPCVNLELWLRRDKGWKALFLA